MLFPFNLAHLRAFFDRKNKCQKLAKSKANPIKKWPKNGHFWAIFSLKKRLQLA